MSTRSKLLSRSARLLQFPLSRLVLAVLLIGGVLRVAQLTLAFTLMALPASLGQNAWLEFLAALVPALAALLAYRVFVRLVERRPASELSRRGAFMGLCAGVLAGALLFSLTILILWLLGSYRVVGTGRGSDALVALGRAVSAGVLEEILFRGLLFRLVEESVGTWLALLLSALLFGFAHAGNAGATLFSSLAVALEGGVLLAAVYVLTRRLWPVMGLHTSWNFLQGGVFGSAVSGHDTGGLLRGELSGPELLSGGAFGAEASVVALVVCLAASALVLAHARRQHNFLAPAWTCRRATGSFSKQLTAER